MALKVKDIVYLLDKKSHALVPCLVIEIISSVSIDGEKTYHIVQTPGKKKLKLQEYTSPWFSSIEEAQQFLLETATSMIQQTVDDALLSAREHFDYNHNKELEISSPEEQTDFFKNVQDSEERVKIDLGNGQTATVSLPSEIINEKNTSN